ncbi:hypothetical protein N7478_003946 [Penicillium angulare]|uniref:uncharacterized protein n=1 Tax=Penicillium angulare TaxID=116970 RepID=UPI002542447B|nr:uncharacterized protein N7478_003946 [Penicillium angulare]KAJ5278574.1 hypothetical protein N7478_003946 [Penicillium angulare]
MAPPSQFLRSKYFVLYSLLSIGFTIYLLIVSSSSITFGTLSAADRHPKQHIPNRGSYAIAIFLASKSNERPEESDDNDGYYVSARTIVYQLLHSPSTKLRYPVPLVILVSQHARESKRQRLRDDGAIVVEVDEVAHNMTITIDRWTDTFTKLRLFDPSVVPYQKVLLMDADIALTRPIDAIFQDSNTDLYETNQTALTEPERESLPEKYVMAASPESLQRDHSYPFLDPDNLSTRFNSGLLIYSPSTELFQYYLKLLQNPDLYYTGGPDQDLLNYAHRWGGPMPWRRLHYSWYLNWPNDNDLKGNMAILHTKWWDHKFSYSSDSVEKFAFARRWEMEGYWIGKEGQKSH